MIVRPKTRTREHERRKLNHIQNNKVKKGMKFLHALT